MKFKKFNLFFASFIISGCIFDMAMGSFFKFHLIYFFYLFIIINVIGNIKPDLTSLKNNISFTSSAILFVIICLINFNYVDNLPIIKGEIFNIIWWSLFVVFLNRHIVNKEDFHFLLNKIFYLTFLFSFITSLCGAYKFLAILNGNELSVFYTDSGDLINGTSLTADYNIFALGLILGVISGKFIYEITLNKIFKNVILLVQIFMLVIVLLSNSRRGFIFIFIALFIMFFYSESRKNKFELKKFFLLIILCIIIFSLFENFLNILINNDYSLEIFNRLSTLKTNEFMSDRVERLDYGYKLINNYSFSELIKGKGFFYFESYSANFNTELGSDHPHNFFLSTFLYGGVISFGIICYLTFRVIQVYLNNLRFFKVLPYWYFLILIVAFTSSSSFFSIKLMIILTLIPFMNFNHKLKL
jgi:hypothetical protein